MALSDYVDPKRCCQLIFGVLGIHISLIFISGINQAMIKYRYANDENGQQAYFTWPQGFLIFPSLIAWAIGSFVNCFLKKREQSTPIPANKSIVCALLVVISTLTTSYAFSKTSYPVVMIFKSCGLISVILVGVLFSRVKDQRLKLTSKKILVGLCITGGIIMFRVFDQQFFDRGSNQTEIMGIILLTVSIIADGFISDFLAQIKSQNKPNPIKMMTQISKWISILALTYSCITLEIRDIYSFIMLHRLFLVHMLIFGILNTIGQIFVYYMIKQFKQHFAPMVITTRKIFILGLSILYYHHETNFFQLLGLLLVFVIVSYQFITELLRQKAESGVIVPVFRRNDSGFTQFNITPSVTYYQMREDNVQNNTIQVERPNQRIVMIQTQKEKA